MTETKGRQPQAEEFAKGGLSSSEGREELCANATEPSEGDLLKAPIINSTAFPTVGLAALAARLSTQTGDPSTSRAWTLQSIPGNFCLLSSLPFLVTPVNTSQDDGVATAPNSESRDTLLNALLTSEALGIQV